MPTKPEERRKLIRLLDYLLIDYMRTTKMTPEQLEGPEGTNYTHDIIGVLRQAEKEGIPITLTWAEYFARRTR